MKTVVRPFTLDFFYKGELYPFYRYYLNRVTNAKNINEDFDQDSYPEDSVVVINDIPPYLSLINDQPDQSFNKIQLPKYTGFLADLSNFGSVDEYLTSQRSSRSRYQIRRSIKRLEACFDIRYEIYHGSIEKQEYDALFDRLRYMIEKRFSQRGDIHLALADWDSIRKGTYQQILDKRASLFVIFDRNKPIDICVNYHLDGIVNNLIRSYDIDYGKFSLGAIDLYKQIQWCFENDYSIFDLSRGEMLYKKQWCNREYYLDCYILYPRKKAKVRIQALKLSAIYRLKEQLKKWKVDILLTKMKKTLKGNPDHKERLSKPLLSSEIIANPVIDQSARDIDFESSEFDNYRTRVYDFQFNYKEVYSDLRFLSLDKQNRTLLVIGKKKSVKISGPHSSDSVT